MAKKENTFEVITFGDPIKGAEEGVDKVINATLAEIATQAKLFAPVYPRQASEKTKKYDKHTGGRLRNSIMYSGPSVDGGFNDGPGEKASSTEKMNSKGKKGVGYVGTNVDYGTYIEFGTKYMKPQPFLRPALRAADGMGAEEIGKYINDEVKKWTKKNKK
jgi:HK97 gp10 family phage protein